MRGVIGPFFDGDFPNSALQESVLNWLANTDPANLAFDTDLTTLLLERYTAAFFYFAMQGYFWTDQTGRLSQNSVCSWKGVACNNQAFLTEIIFGTCLLASFCL